MNIESVPVSWSIMDSDPYNRDPTQACLPCKSISRPPTHGTPAPPPAPGQAPCLACPANNTYAQRLITRDAGPPCCITETYGHTAWPWQWGGNVNTPDGDSPELWQDHYVVKDRTATGFDLTPSFNPYVL